MKAAAYSDMFTETLIDLDLSAENTEEVFEVVAARLESLDFVAEGYLQGIKDREREFPTGLGTRFLNIALPHTDVQHVKRPFVYIARLKNDIAVKAMGDRRELLTRDLLFLGIKDPKGQVGLLQALLNLFMDEGFVREFKDCRDPKQMCALVAGSIQHI